MDAASWTDGLRALRTEFRDLRERRRLDEDLLWGAVRRLNDRLLDLGRMAAAIGAPPRLDRKPRDTVDRAVRRILDALYRGESPRQAAADAVERASQDGRCTPAAESSILPLHRDGPAVANWYVLLPWTSDRLEELATECRRIRQRVDAVANDLLSATYADVRKALSLFATILSQLVAKVLWLDPPGGLVEADYEQVESFVERVVEATER